MKHKTTLTFLFIGISLFLISCTDNTVNTMTVSPIKTSISIHKEMGLPTDKDSSDDYIINRPQYVVSYNKNLHVPNWVSWNLNASWYGDVPRFSGSFISDTSLPESFYRVKHSDYTNSGYDRGHMVRSEERTATDIDNKSTFILTSILPQTPKLNQQTWLSLEYACEDWCKKNNKEIYVIAGGRFPKTPELLKGIVAVPDSCWKIVVIMNRGQKIADITPNTPVIAVMMSNSKTDTLSNTWKNYKTTVRHIEQSTGYNFFQDIPKTTQDILETTINTVDP